MAETCRRFRLQLPHSSCQAGCSICLRQHTIDERNFLAYRSVPLPFPILALPTVNLPQCWNMWINGFVPFFLPVRVCLIGHAVLQRCWHISWSYACFGLPACNARL